MGAELQSLEKTVQKPSTASANAGFLQRKCDKCRKKAKLLHRPTAEFTSEVVPPVIHEALHSPGQPLDPSIRTIMESRFRYDFSSVRVHTDAKAEESTKAVNARAYAFGQDIVLGAGQYMPMTDVGRQLIVHELAHIIQQRGTLPFGPAYQLTPLRLGPRNDAYEQEADITATRFTSSDQILAPKLRQKNAIINRQFNFGADNGQKTASRQSRTGSSIPYKEATELADCVRIMGEANMAYCRQQVLHEKPPLAPPPAHQSDCERGKALRWGCDTTCSHNGFIDTTLVPKAGSPVGATGCCNRWPPFVEKHAREVLSLNGAASCKGAARRMNNKLATVTYGGKSVKVLCTDAFGANQSHAIELSPLAMKDLHGNFENISKVEVCYSDSGITTCRTEVNNSSKSPPSEDDCIARSCKSSLSESDRKDCSEHGWPPE
jgi:hypothetical protein